MTTLRYQTYLGIVLLSLISGQGRADEVQLDNGSRLAGKIQKLSDGVLILETDFAGTLKIDISKVTGIETDSPISVALDNGEQVTGPLRVGPDGGQRVSDTSFGEVSVDPAQLKAAWLPDQLSPMDEALEKSKPKWTASAELGLDGQTGTSERSGFFGRVEANRTAPRDRQLIYVQGRYSKQDGERSVNEILGGFDLEVDITDRLFTFGSIELEFDEFEDLDLRSTVSTGLGYFVIREPDEELKLRAGIGYQHESFMDGTSVDDAVAVLGYDYRKEIAPWVDFTHSTTYYPSFGDFAGDYRIVSETGGTIPLASSNDWHLKLGMRNEYDSMPRPGVERLDTFYFINLLKVFE